MEVERRTADRFRNVVNRAVKGSQKPDGLYEFFDRVQARTKKEVNPHVITFSVYEPAEVGKKDLSTGITTPSHSIKVFTHEEHPHVSTSFEILDNVVTGVHTVDPERLVFPIISSLETPQVEALLDFAENPENPENEAKLAIARKLSEADQELLEIRMANDAALDAKLSAHLWEMYKTRPRLYPEIEGH